MNKKWLESLSALVHTHLTMTRPSFFTYKTTMKFWIVLIISMFNGEKWFEYF